MKSLFKNKKKIEAMDYDTFMKHRRNFLRKSGYPYSTDEAQYAKELEYYMEYQFKDVYMARYDGYEKLVQDNVGVAKGVDSNLDMARILTGMDKEALYDFSLQQALEKIGEFQFIK